MKKIFAISAVLAVTAVMPAMAHGTPEQKEAMLKTYFDKVDTNKDGKISDDEHEDFSERKFKEADANHDEFVTLDEAREAHKKEWAEIKDKKADKADKKNMSKAANANPTEHSANPTNPSQHHSE